jgi:DNA polymerase I-like protein with 3'-5' exonuclease and polymerase domains
MQFSTKPGEGYMLVWDHPERPMPMRQKQKVRGQLRQLLLNPNTSVVGQNAKYDLMWMWAHLGFRYRIDHDTLMMVALLDENLQNKDLDTIVKMYAPDMGGYADAFNQKYDKSRMDLVPLVDLLDYGCGDVDAVQRVFPKLEQQLRQDDKLWTHYRRVSIPGINAFAAMESVGLLTNSDAILELEHELDAYLKELTIKLMRQIPSSIKKQHMEKGLSFTRKEFLVDVLFNHKDGFKLPPKVFTKTTQRLPENMRIPSTSAKDHLPYFFEECPFTIDLAEWVKTERLLNTSIRNFRTKYVYEDRVYPSYSLWTAVTGRSASSDPNGQNFPKRGKFAKAYRKIFVPPEGYVMLEADLSQAELRIAGSMAKDRRMISIYNSDGDIHTVTACIVLGVSAAAFAALPKEERDLARFKAKAVNFGFLYGMGWRKFIVYAKTQYGVEFTEREAQRIREAFFSTYTSLEAWHIAVREFVREHGYVRSYSGRVRHLPMIYSNEESVRMEAERQAVNSPVQEFASTLGIMAMSRIDQEVDSQYFTLYGFVHDALYAYVPSPYVEWGAKTMKHYMESNPLKEWFGVTLPIAIKADVGFGLNGKEIHGMSSLELDEPYDFSQHEIELPEQRTPPNNGRIVVPDYMRIAA